LFSVNFIEQIV